MIEWHNYRSIVALDGTIADIAHITLPVIACDGAADTLIERNIYPELIVGDLDSVSESAKKACPCIHIPEQDTSDFQKALKVAKERNLLPAIVVGLNGGYLDHILQNINVISTTECLFYDPPIIGFMMQEGTRVLKLARDTKISLIAMPEATVETSGLKWNLDNDRLTFPGKNSCFNRVLDPDCTITVVEGSLLIMIYLETISDAGI
ncbi:MAG: thiamine diphosphokinase [Verrucomicrobia bacterium]|nr:thiamine diphosphokinase [Verrucomicrobiota bacterium]MBS0637158.1 thiamine diphosphokinase [Verrucomicrobiota bacterium]